MQCPVLRDYQEPFAGQIRAAWKEGHRRICLCLPTGSGKTETIIDFAAKALEGGKCNRVWLFVDSITLVHQTAKRFQEYGADVGILQGGNTRNLDAPIIIATPQTFMARTPKVARNDLIIIDECHVWYADFLSYIASLNAYIIGMTATPFRTGLTPIRIRRARTEGRFSELYTHTAFGPSLKQLQREDWLAPLDIITPPEVIAKEDIEWYDAQGDVHEGTRDFRVEYKGESIAKAAVTIVGNFVGRWETETHKAFGGPVPTLGFAPTINFAQEMVDRFNNAGYHFARATSKDPKAIVEQHINDLKNGGLQGIITCDMLAKGLDVPNLQCIIDAATLKVSVGRQIQKLGRGTRIADGKERAIVLDHAGNWPKMEEEITAFWETNTLPDFGALKARTIPGEANPNPEPIVINEIEDAWSDWLTLPNGQMMFSFMRGDWEG